MLGVLLSMSFSIGVPLFTAGGRVGDRSALVLLHRSPFLEVPRNVLWHPI